MTRHEKVELVARTLAGCRHGYGDYDEVPVDEVFSRNRYLFLAASYRKQAAAVIEALEGAAQ